MGEVIRDGKIIGYYEYNGTCDVLAGNLICDTEDAVHEHWREQPWSECPHAADSHVPVVIYSSYGGGFYWDGKACMDCRIVTDGLSPESTVDGHPLGHPHRRVYFNAI